MVFQTASQKKLLTNILLVKIKAIITKYPEIEKWDKSKIKAAYGILDHQDSDALKKPIEVPIKKTS